MPQTGAAIGAGFFLLSAMLARACDGAALSGQRACFAGAPAALSFGIVALFVDRNAGSMAH